MERLNSFVHKIGLPDSFTDKLVSNSQMLTLKKNDHLMKEGDICPCIGILLEGSMVTYFIDAQANENINDIRTPVSFVCSYRSFLEQVRSKEFVKATEDSKILAISYETFECRQKEFEWLKFFKSASDQFFLRKCAREKALNTYTAKERYQQLIEKIPLIEQVFPQYMIASYLNIRPETLSRLKSLDLHQE